LKKVAGKIFIPAIITAFCPLKNKASLFYSKVVGTGQNEATFPVTGKCKTVK
jgi:hypothetical protein